MIYLIFLKDVLQKGRERKLYFTRVIAFMCHCEITTKPLEQSQQIKNSNLIYGCSFDQ